MSSPPHPARSLDFLSRLHDGELTPAERAHFESHRAHCGECRRAAADFEDALAVYRTAGTSAPPSDLAARILRRLESSNRRRNPFGVVFGIDLRWAGGFTAALIAVIIGYSVLDRREEPRQIAVSFAPSTPRPSASPAAPPLRSEAKANSRESLAPRPAAAAQPAGERAADAAGAANDELAAAAGAPNVSGQNQARAAKPSRALAREKREDPSLTAARPAAPEELSSNRLVVTPLDGEGAPPSVLNAAQLAFRREDRGRYLLVIGTDGVPSEVRSVDATGKETGAVSGPALDTLGKLRFQPGVRPRRLLVRFE